MRYRVDSYSSDFITTPFNKIVGITGNNGKPTSKGWPTFWYYREAVKELIRLRSDYPILDFRIIFIF